MKILNEAERTGNESLYSESYVVDFREEGEDGFWRRGSMTYYATNKKAHRHVLARFRRDFQYEKKVANKVTYQ